MKTLNTNPFQITASSTSLKELMEQRVDLIDEAQELASHGNPTSAQLERFNAITSEGGEADRLIKKIDAAREAETNQKVAATLRLSSSGFDISDNEFTRNPPHRKSTMNAVPQVLATRNLEAFKGPNAAEKAYGCGMWLRAIVARHRGHTDEAAEAVVNAAGYQIYGTATEGTDSAGGYVVPDPLASAIIETRERVGISRPLADIRGMTSETLRIPVQTAGPVVTYPGEASAITPSDSTWGQVNLTATKRSILSKLSNELTSDAIINLVDQCISRMGYEFAKQEDAEFINGDGSGTYGGEYGLLDQLGAAGVYTAGTGDDTWGELTLPDFTNTMAVLPSAHATGAESWICSSAFYYEVMVKLLNEAGGNTLVNLEAGTGSRPTFLGKPVYMTDEMPKVSAASTVSCLYGSFRNAVIIGDRKRLEIAISTDRYFEEDVIALRAIARYDIEVHDSGDGSDAGAYVGLSTAP